MNQSTAFGGFRAALAARLKQSDLWLVAGMFGTVMLLVLPVPPFLLDLMLTVSIAISLLILLVILYVRNPLLQQGAGFAKVRMTQEIRANATPRKR